MKKVFRYKKGEVYDWDDSLHHKIDETLAEYNYNGYYVKGNYKVTLIIEKEKVKQCPKKS